MLGAGRSGDSQGTFGSYLVGLVVVLLVLVVVVLKVLIPVLLVVVLDHFHDIIVCCGLTFG